MSAWKPPPALKSSVPSQIITTPEQKTAFFRRTTRAVPQTRFQRGTTVATFLGISFVIGYAVFVADFGDKEHVFVPPRRWLARQRQAFWTLSPGEQEVLRQHQQDLGTLQPVNLPKPI